MGMGAPMTGDVSGHRALKKQQNSDTGVSLETFKHASQMNFSLINKLSSFTNIMTNIENHKNHKFSLKWPEHLVLLLLQLICNKNHKLQLTQM